MFGIYTRIRHSSKKFTKFCQKNFYKYQRGNRNFTFNKSQYNYFIHSYNYTWRNERSIEIPIIQKILKDNEGKDILEVGNVMAHYINITHDILDKYEKSPGVINQDVVSFKGEKKYDLIISISTLEHVGWDEKNQDSKKVLKAVSNLKLLLRRGGRIVISHPLGYNSFMDEYITGGELIFSETYLMKRISGDNIWKQVPWKKQLIRYNYPFPYANGIVIGVIKK